jgi:hypothetical protein
MHVIGHDDISADAYVVICSTGAIASEFLVNFCIREQRASMQCAKRYEIQRLVDKNQIESRRFSFDHHVPAAGDGGLYNNSSY